MAEIRTRSAWRAAKRAHGSTGSATQTPRLRRPGEAGHTPIKLAVRKRTVAERQAGARDVERMVTAIGDRRNTQQLMRQADATPLKQQFA